MIENAISVPKNLTSTKIPTLKLSTPTCDWDIRATRADGSEYLDGNLTPPHIHLKGSMLPVAPCNRLPICELMGEGVRCEAPFLPALDPVYFIFMIFLGK